MRKPLIVVSAVNFFEGGPLTVLRENLKFLNDQLAAKYRIIALVHRTALFSPDEFPNVQFYEYPKSRSSYLRRFYLEYIYFKKLSRSLAPDLWLALHDMTPNVVAKRQVVYCHNPTPFKKLELKDLLLQPKIFFFTLFYSLMYRINIKQNKYVVVQQAWMKNEFMSRYGLSSEDVLVCHPDFEASSHNMAGQKEKLPAITNGNLIFFYPALSRPFKNFEIIAEAIIILNATGITGFEVFITITGHEDTYANYIYKKYSHLKALRFIGRLSSTQVHGMYEVSDVLLFSSKLETWGLPLSEFKAYSKPILASSLPYARETVGAYDKVKFFNPDKAQELADAMKAIIQGRIDYDQNVNINEPYLQGWRALFDKILSS